MKRIILLIGIAMVLISGCYQKSDNNTIYEYKAESKIAITSFNESDNTIRVCEIIDSDRKCYSVIKNYTK